MIRILANDGINPSGYEKLVAAGFEVITENIPQEILSDRINEFDCLLVRSATQVDSSILDAGIKLKLVGRAGVGLDNINLDHAKNKGVEVINTPRASSLSVAELVFAHLFSCVRFLNDSNRKMPSQGYDNFKALKSNYSKGIELKGKVLGIIGFGRIGQEVAKIAIGIGMDVYAYNKYPYTAEITFDFPKHITNAELRIPVHGTTKDEVLQKSDFITLHTPFVKEDGPVISKIDFNMMRNGVGIINCARGGVIDEQDLLESLNTGKVSFAGLDVFENEPLPSKEILEHPKISLTPHIGASTIEAQQRIGEELAEKVIAFFSS